MMLGIGRLLSSQELQVKDVHKTILLNLISIHVYKSFCMQNLRVVRKIIVKHETDILSKIALK